MLQSCGKQDEITVKKGKERKKVKTLAGYILVMIQNQTTKEECTQLNMAQFYISIDMIMLLLLLVQCSSYL